MTEISVTLDASPHIDVVNVSPPEVTVSEVIHTVNVIDWEA